MHCSESIGRIFLIFSMQIDYNYATKSHIWNFTCKKWVFNLFKHVLDPFSRRCLWLYQIHASIQNCHNLDNFYINNIKMYIHPQGVRISTFQILVLKILFWGVSSGAIRFMLQFKMGGVSNLCLKSKDQRLGGRGCHVRSLVQIYVKILYQYASNGAIGFIQQL